MQPHLEGLQPKDEGPAEVEAQAPHVAKSLSCKQLRRFSPNTAVVYMLLKKEGIAVTGRTNKRCTRGAIENYMMMVYGNVPCLSCPVVAPCASVLVASLPGSTVA